jgi:hypothetical protein
MEHGQGLRVDERGEPLVAALHQQEAEQVVPGVALADPFGDEAFEAMGRVLFVPTGGAGVAFPLQLRHDV